MVWWSDQCTDMLKPIEAKRVSDDVADQLRQLIFAREFSPGTRLPPERELAVRLEVHRSSVREALKRMEGEGLIEIRRGEGAYVREYLKEANLQSLEAFLFSPEGHKLGILGGIQEFRLLVQCQMARFAAERRRDENLAEFDTVLAAMERETDPHKFRALDWAFALAVARGTQNVIFTLVLNSVQDLHRRWGAVYFSAPGTIENTRRFHRLIVRAIRRGDGARAASVMKRLLDYSNPILMENIAKVLL